MIVNRFGDDGIALAIDRLETGLRNPQELASRERAHRLAKRIADQTVEEHLVTQFESATEFSAEYLAPTVSTARRLRKLSEIIEDDLGVDVGHSKFTRVATNLATLSSLGSIAIAGNNLFRASVDLLDQYEVVTSPANIKQVHYTIFYQALAIFILECMLFTTPLNYKTAWLGTRFINNRYLYRLREFSPQLHRYVLSEVHYVIRDIVPMMLRSTVHYADYLLSVTVTCFEVFWEYAEEFPLAEIPDKINEIISEFRTFVEESYELQPPELEWDSFSKAVVSEAMNTVGDSFWSVEQGHSRVVDS